MLESLLAGSGDDAETDTGRAADHWDTRDGFRLDDTGGVEAAPDVPFPTADAESVLWSHLHSSPDPIFVVDSTGESVYSNAECRELFDRELGELIGTNIFEYDNADNSAMREVLDTGESLRGLSESIVTDDGAEISVERYLYPLYGADEDLLGGIELTSSSA